MNALQLLTDHLALWSSADTEKKSGRGRASGNTASVYGIKKLRDLILELAIRGKLVPQDENDEPAGALVKRIQAEKSKLITEGKIKKSKPFSEITDDEKPFELPKSWEWVRLGNIGHDWGQKTPSSDFTYIEVSAIDSQLGVVSSPDLVKPEDAPSRARKIVQSGTVIYSTIRPYLLNIAVIEENYEPEPIASTAFAIIHPFCQMPPRYFLHYLRSPIFVRYVESVQMGIAYPAINDSQFFSGLIPLPPIAEQHRIVAKLDELMLLCDQLENQHTNASAAHEKLVSYLLDTLTQSKGAADFNESWQRIATNFEMLFSTESSIDALKQTLLQLAVMGKLVPQDASDEPASELLKRIQAEKAQLVAEGQIKKSKPLSTIGEQEKLFKLPNGWEWVRFEHIAENSKHALKAGPFGSALKKDMYTESGYKIYGQEQVISGDENFGDYYIDDSKFQQLSSCAIKSGDILISLVGTIGRVLVLSDNCELGIINPRLVKISLFKEIDRNFIKIIFASPLFRIELAEKSHGGTMNILNLGLLCDLKLSLPPLAEQHRIVTKVDELMSLCDTLKSRITAANQLQKKIADVMVERAISKDNGGQTVTNNIIEFQLSQDDDYKLLVLAAEITFQLQNESTYGHLKLQKLIYLCQQIRNMALPTNFFRAAAGPYDREMAHYIDGEFLKRGWFDYDKERKPKYRQLELCGGHQADFNKYFASEAKHIYHLIDLFRTNLSENIEIVATLFACWKEVINSKESVTDELLLERFYAWSDEKRKFQNNQVLEMLEWMRVHSIVPLSSEKIS